MSQTPQKPSSSTSAPSNQSEIARADALLAEQQWERDLIDRLRAEIARMDAQAAAENAEKVVIIDGQRYVQWERKN